MPQSVLTTGLVALFFALVHVFGNRMRFLRVTPRSVWLSLAGGVSLAYVFMHLLPELAERQDQSLEHLRREGEGLLGLHVYMTALLGLIIFYALDRLVRKSKEVERGAASTTSVFWLHVGSYAVYSVLIGYLLVNREEADLRGLIIYAIAMGLHFIINDQGLREYHGAVYDRQARWVLAGAPLAGWAVGILVKLSPVTVATIFAFLAGSIILNVLKEELPEERESRFWALGAGATAFAVLLLLSR